MLSSQEELGASKNRSFEIKKTTMESEITTRVVFAKFLNHFLLLYTCGNDIELIQFGERLLQTGRFNHQLDKGLLL